MSGKHKEFFAEFYDILHEGNYSHKIYVEKLREYGEDILELGSGTGRILIPLIENDYNAVGIEKCEDMIALCNKKSKGKAEVIKGDGKIFSLDRKFNVVLASCNFINKFNKIEDLVSMFKCAKEHLKDNGVFIIDCSLPYMELMVNSNGLEETFEFYNKENSTKIVDKFKATYDFTHSKEVNERILEEYKGEELLRRAEVKEEITYYMPRELKAIIELSGLKIIKESGSLKKDIPIEGNAGEMILYCTA